MVYVLIVLGFAVVIAPLMSAMPSKTQRAKAALRDQARACNSVSYTHLTLPTTPYV